MKALQGKKPGLRGVWRMVLTALCVAALAFAIGACSSGDGGDDGGRAANSGRVPIRLEKVTNPSVPTYQALKVNLAGVSARVIYSDGTYEDVTDPSRFSTYPRYGTGEYIPNKNGWYDQASEIAGRFVGRTSYELLYSEDGYPPVRATISTRTIGIKRDSGQDELITFDPYRAGDWGWKNAEGSDYWGQPYWAINQFYGSLGLSVTGTETMKKRTYYVDDEEVDFTGIVMGAIYEDDSRQVIPLQGIEDPEHVRWQIRPRYDGNKGDLIITVGFDPSVPPVGYMPGVGSSGVSSSTIWQRWWNGARKDAGVSTIIDLDAVYKVDKIEFAAEPKVEDNNFFYWEDDDHSTWAGKSSGMALKVTYSDGNAKELKLADLTRRNSNLYGQIATWYNPDWFYNDKEGTADSAYDGNRVRPWPYESGLPFYISGINETRIRKGQTRGDDVHNTPNSAITYYYRGWPLEQAWPVFVRFESLEVNPVGGEDPIKVDMAIRPDNDNRSPMNASVFGGKIEAKVVFSAFGNRDLKSKAQTITYWDSQRESDSTEGAPRQKVRIYYRAYRIRDWRISAIERL